jgi:hypothetical protein
MFFKCLPAAWLERLCLRIFFSFRNLVGRDRVQEVERCTGLLNAIPRPSPVMFTIWIILGSILFFFLILVCMLAPAYEDIIKPWYLLAGVPFFVAQIVVTFFYNKEVAAMLSAMQLSVESFNEEEFVKWELSLDENNGLALSPFGSNV